MDQRTISNQGTDMCPRCGVAGRSVAAMNYKETQRWRKVGSASGSGVGIGTFGVGVGFGGGSYSERGEIATKRAAVFDEPAPVKLPVLSIIAVACIAAMVYNSAPGILEMFSGAVPAQQAATPMAQTQEALSSIVYYIAPIVGAVILGIGIYHAFKNMREEDRLNATAYPAQLARYNKLRYCEHCNSLFDGHGRVEDANELGFKRLMN